LGTVTSFLASYLTSDRGSSGLPPEASQTLRVLGELLRQHLYRNFTAQVGVLGTVHFAHTPLANFLENPVVANGLAEHGTPLGAMQLRPMLRVEGVKGNTHDQDVFTQSHMFEFANSIVLTWADLW